MELPSEMNKFVARVIERLSSQVSLLTNVLAIGRKLYNYFGMIVDARQNSSGLVVFFCRHAFHIDCLSIVVSYNLN